MRHIKFEEDGNSAKREEETEEAELAEKWFANLPADPVAEKPPDENSIDVLKKEANGVLHGESLAYETKLNRGGSSDQKWAQSLLMKGAVGDRVAAATVLIQDSPLHHLNTLRNLVSMVKPAKKKDSLTVIETLSELFLFDLLLPEAKLRRFETRPLSELEKMSSGNRDHRRKILTQWIFEDQLKEIYGEFIKNLNTFAHDTIEMHKEKAVSVMSKLLMHNPEQEKVLLSNIINKLGDPSQKVASKVIYHLCQVLYNHPNMKQVVLNEIEKMLFRPNISPKAQYYGVCFLNQFYLTKDDNKVAENLVRVYFSFFKASIKQGDIDSRLMSAILTGVKRCQPFLGQQKMEEIQTQADALHRLVHLARYNIALHALALLFQISPLSVQLSDRYYCALYKKLCDPETLITTLPALMMNLVYRSIKVDKCRNRVFAFLKRLLQLANMSDPPRACAFLLLIARLARNKKLPMQWTEKLEVKDEVPNVESITENIDVDKSKDSTNNEYIKKVKKKKKNQNSKISDEIMNMKKSFLIGDKADLLNDEDDEETYHDIPLEEDEEEHKKKVGKIVKNKQTATHSWMHLAANVKNEPKVVKNDDSKQNDERNNDVDNEKEKELKILIKKSKNMEKVITEYDPFHRNPSYCGAEHSVFCELMQLSNHFHPTVRLFAEKILDGAFIQYNGDPLIDFSIARFLDRFAFKNPKKDPEEAVENNGVKVIKGSHPKFAQRKNYIPAGIRGLAVNSQAYLNENSDHIPVDERFLYDYLQMRKVKKDEDSDAMSDAGSVDSEDFERYLDGLTGKQKDDDESDDEGEKLDYVKEMMEHSKTNVDKVKQKKKKGDNDNDEEDWSVSEDDDENESVNTDIDDDSELEFSDEEMTKKASKNKKQSKNSDSESDIAFSDDEDDVFDMPKVSEKKKGKKGIESMFASAEEFATLLEESGTVKGQGTSQAMANRENANVKQLNWESQRDRFVKGFNKKSNFTNRRFEKKSHDGQNKKHHGDSFKRNNAAAGHKRKFTENKKMQSKRTRY